VELPPKLEDDPIDELEALELDNVGVKPLSLEVRAAKEISETQDR